VEVYQRYVFFNTEKIIIRSREDYIINVDQGKIIIR